jgi:hypothetical protein
MKASAANSNLHLVPAKSERNRREHRRFPGPFDARRVAALETPVRIYDLSRGGCFITSLHEQQPGIVMTLRIELPGEGWVTVTAETLPRQNEFGYAVRFVGMDIDSAERLDRALQHLAEREPYDP